LKKEYEFAAKEPSNLRYGYVPCRVIAADIRSRHIAGVHRS
jgi:hypothetical protein